MKFFVVFLLFFALFFSSAFSQENQKEDNPVLSTSGTTYKDVIVCLKSDKSYAQKMEMVRSLESLHPVDKVNDIYERMVKLALDSNMISDFVELKSSQAFVNILDNKLDEAKKILESAHIYLDKVTNPSSVGVYYLIEGKYYAALLDEKKMINSYYKSIDSFEKGDGRRTTMVTLLYSIAGYYYQYKDLASMHKLKDRMLSFANEANEPSSYIQTYSIISAYYELSWNKDSIANDRDSTIYYNQKIIDVYSKADEASQRSSAALTIQACLNIAEFMIVQLQNSPDIGYKWKDIDYYINKTSDLKDYMDITNQFRYYYLKGEVSFYYKKYEEAINLAKKSLAYITENDNHVLNKMSMYRVYDLLSRSEEKKGNYKAALEYYKQGAVIYQETLDERKYEVGKELETKYETAKKDLEISQLNEREQKLLYNRMLIIAISAITVVLLLLTTLYFRFKKKQKEHENILKDKYIEEKEYESQMLLNEIETTRMRRYLDGLEAERSRLAKELHDSIANELYVTTIEMEKIDSISDQITDRMKNLHKQIRAISHDLMPPEFQYASIVDIIYNHLLVIEKQSDIIFHLNVENEESLENLSPSFSHEIYRITQECVGNIIKHSSAQNAVISLSSTDNVIDLKIEDDGVGFDLSAMYKKGKGIGFTIIEERSNSLGGKVRFETKEGKGCKIIVSIPTNDSEK